MTYKKQVIKDHWQQYKEMYFDKFGECPTCWFSYLQWLAYNPGIGNFDSSDIEYAEMVMKGE